MDVAKLTWPQMHKWFKEEYANFLALMDLLLTLPSTSVVCERGFSQMKHIKTDWRNRLGSATLCDLLRIIMHAPDLDNFDPIDAIHLWYQGASKKRQPMHQRHSKSSSKEHDVGQAVADDDLLQGLIDSDSEQQTDSDSDIELVTSDTEMDY